MPNELYCEQLTKAGTPCQNLVAVGSTHCSAGHAIPASRWSRHYAETSNHPSVAMDVIDAEDLMGDTSVSVQADSWTEGVDSPVGHGVHPLLSPDGDSVTFERRDFGFEELAKWSATGVTTPEVILALRDDYGISPEEACTRMISKDGYELTLGQLVENGELEVYDAPMAVATWPGEGWSFDGEQFQWQAEASVEELAGIYRENCMDSAASEKYPDEVIAAQLAGTIGQLSSNISGANMVVKRASYNALNEKSFSGVDDDFLRDATRAAEQTLRSGRGQDPYGQFRQLWLGQLTTN